MIDLIITNKSKRFTSTICVDTGLSDYHFLVCTATKIQLSTLAPIIFKYRSYKHFNNDLFLEELSKIPYHVTEIFDDVNDSYWLWHQLTMQVVNEHAPLKTGKVRGQRAPYMNGKLRRAINVKNMLKRKFEKVGNKENWNNYRLQRNIVTKLRKNSINVYLAKKCNVNTANNFNGYGFWETIKPLISKNGGVKNDNIVLMKDDIVHTKPDKVATIFNTYFTNIAKEIGNGCSNYTNVNDNVSSFLVDYENHESIRNIKNFMESGKDTKVDFSFNKVDVAAVKLCIDNLKSKKATGYDMLPSKLLKIGSDILSYSICSIINMSVTLCSFPNALKCAEITPLFKKCNNLDVCNYRPVSILPSMSKIFERQLVIQLGNYFDCIFSKHLSGFRAKHSCETVLLRMVENIKQYVDEGKIVCILIMDLSRAFDCLPYKLFVCKLHAYGFSLSACELMFNYYRYRKQRVKLGNHFSEWQNIYKATAQGSIMGPITYNMFTNDMILVLDDNIEVYNYVDDNSLLSAGYDYSKTQQKLLCNVERLMSWFELNQMKVNPDKFNYIVFGKNDNVRSLNIKSIIIEPQNEVKILGLNLDNRLTFNNHVSKLCQKAGKQVQVLSRLSHILSKTNKMLLFNSFVECHFNYCSFIWHFCSKLNTYKVEKIQAKALKCVTLKYKASYCDLLEKCNKSPLFISRLHRFLEIIFKTKHNMYPDYINKMFMPKNVYYNTRINDNMHVPKYNTVTYGKHCLKYMAPFY